MTTPDPAALATSSAKEIHTERQVPWGADGFVAVKPNERETAAIIARHTQPLVDRIKELEGENSTLRNAQMACEDCMTPTYADLRAQLTAANERAETWRENCEAMGIERNKAQHALTASQASVRELREAGEMTLRCLREMPDTRERTDTKGGAWGLWTDACNILSAALVRTAPANQNPIQP